VGGAGRINDNFMNSEVGKMPQKQRDVRRLEMWWAQKFGLASLVAK
jgi:hypothetical protein